MAEMDNVDLLVVGAGKDYLVEDYNYDEAIASNHENNCWLIYKQ